MKELFDSFAFIVYILLCTGVVGSLRLKAKAAADLTSVSILDTAFFNILMVISLLIALASIVVFSIAGEWWYCFVMIGAVFILSSRLAKLIVTSYAYLEELFFGGHHNSWEAVIVMLLEAVFGVWMLIILL